MIRSAEMLLRYKEMGALTRTQGQVYLIYRLDQDEAKVGGIFAAPYGTPKLDTIQGEKPIPVRKMQTTSDKSVKGKQLKAEGGYKLASPLRGTKMADQQGGGHAEEFFLQFFLGRHRADPVTHVDLMISRVPCHDTSAEWRLPDYFGGSLPMGCGPKLRAVAASTPEVQWQISYEELGRNPNLSALGEINALRNAISGSMHCIVENF